MWPMGGNLKIKGRTSGREMDSNNTDNNGSQGGVPVSNLIALILLGTSEKAKQKQQKCMYTNIVSSGNKMEELELLVCVVKLDKIEVNETWSHSSHAWNMGH